METIIRLGRRGVVTLPKEMRESAGLKEGDTLVVSLDSEGGISLRHAAVLPLREYGENELSEFREEDEMDSKMRRRLDEFLRS